MKKLILSTLLCSSLYSFGQTIFSEDFEGSTSLPTNWVQYNVDGKTPASSVNFMGTNAWVIRDYSNNGMSKTAVSTSYYSPAGKSDDWLVTPLISLPAGDNYILNYDIMAPDADYPDNYELWVTTAGNTVADFTTSGTKLLAEIGNPGEMKTKFINLSAYSGQDIYLAFRNVANDKYLLFLDNVKVAVLKADDVQLTKVSHNRLSLKDVNNPIKYSVFNKGSNAVTSIHVTYSDGTTSVDEDINVNIPAFTSKDVTLTTPLKYSTVVEKVFSHKITLVNGNTDSDTLDNTWNTTKFNTISENYQKNVVIEEGTGTWCGWCPRGAVAMEYMYNTYPDRFIGIAVHNGDPMKVTAYDDGADFSGFPSSNVDRAILGADVDETAFENYYNARKDLPTLSRVSGTVTSNGNDLTIVANAEFNTIITNNQLRLGVVMVEDNVKGTASGYNQTNYYANNAAGPMGGFENLPDPVPAAQMVYNHVGRALLGGYTGQTGSVPANITETTTASYTFNYTVPSASEKNNMSAVILIIDNETGEIYNATKITAAVASTNDLSAVNPMSVYPNPTSKELNVELGVETGDYTVSVYDLTGKKLIENAVKSTSGTQKTTLDVSRLAKGNYIVSIATVGKSYTKHFVVE